MHGSSDDRFKITYCPGHLSQEEIEGVRYNYADLPTMMQRFDPDRLQDGWNEVDGQRIYFSSQSRSRFVGISISFGGRTMSSDSKNAPAAF